VEDIEIVELFFQRKESAVAAASEKYKAYCTSIAKNILGSSEDAEECVNDTFLAAWNSIPPQRPRVLSAYLGKLTRNSCLNRYKHRTAAKRGGGELPAVLDELAEIVGAGETVESTVENAELAEALNAFLRSLSPKKRSIFIRRYWFSASVPEIAVIHGMSEGAVSMALGRLRTSLRRYLEGRGYDL